MMAETILIGGNGQGKIGLNLRYANRHGLIAGATGTGKTVTLQGLAEGFSSQGVPVFMADVKGDLSGLCQPGKPHPKIDERVDKIGIDDFVLNGFPVSFWDLFGEQGIPVRSTVSEMGPQLLSRLLDLNETQESILTLAFQFADDEGLLLLNLDDLKTTLSYLADHSKELSAGYGTLSKASINAIFRRLLMFEREGGELFFGEPALNLDDLMATDRKGYGIINLLAADKLIRSPKIYTTFLLWLLSELFENLPEVGDSDKPKLVFFFDEAHLLFNDAPTILLEKIEQMVRLIRSKGVGVYFITQSPGDLPDSVLGQLGNRVQHALRAYTPKDQKAVKAAAQTFRTNPELDTEIVITQLGVGEALVSTLQEGGVPTPVERVLVRPPSSRIGPASKKERDTCMNHDPLTRLYRESVDPHSAHEALIARAKEARQTASTKEEEKVRRKSSSRSSGRSNRQGFGEAFAKSMIRSLGSSVGRKLVRGLLGSLLK